MVKNLMQEITLPKFEQQGKPNFCFFSTDILFFFPAGLARYLIIPKTELLIMIAAVDAT